MTNSPYCRTPKCSIGFESFDHRLRPKSLVPPCLCRAVHFHSHILFISAPIYTHTFNTCPLSLFFLKPPTFQSLLINSRISIFLYLVFSYRKIVNWHMIMNSQAVVLATAMVVSTTFLFLAFGKQKPAFSSSSEIQDHSLDSSGQPLRSCLYSGKQSVSVYG